MIHWWCWRWFIFRQNHRYIDDYSPVHPQQQNLILLTRTHKKWVVIGSLFKGVVKTNEISWIQAFSSGTTTRSSGCTRRALCRCSPQSVFRCCQICFFSCPFDNFIEQCSTSYSLASFHWLWSKRCRDFFSESKSLSDDHLISDPSPLVPSAVPIFFTTETRIL